MSEYIIVIIIAAITGAGLITGLLFAFSNFVMRALADLPQDKGMFAMRRINVKIINPLFMLLFLGTPLLCVVILIQSFSSLDASASLMLSLGALLYLLGPFAVTMIFNVPLNNRLAASDVSQAQDIWPMYQIRWQRWNHIRTYMGVVSIVLLASGLSQLT